MSQVGSLAATHQRFSNPRTVKLPIMLWLQAGEIRLPTLMVPAERLNTHTQRETQTD